MMSGRIKRLERAAAETLQEARREISIEIINSIMKPSCDLFMTVYNLPDPQERIDQFAAGMDEIVDDYLASRDENSLEK